MAWWRHDPSLWARSPAHRYAQRILRDHEATLRTRCFSRTPSNTAQHQDHNSTTRPDGMTDQEWAQLQRYRKWRKMLLEHPYRGLFGASEDMLRGKGLTDWEWVYKTFPKWMLQEMEPHGPETQCKDGSKSHPGQTYRTKAEGEDQDGEQRSTERRPAFAQPVIRTTHYERDEFGIVSPSDLRRPREASHVKAVGKYGKEDVSKITEPLSSSAPISEEGASRSNLQQPDTSRIESLEPHINPERSIRTAKEASDRESSFIDEFLAKDSKVYDRDLGNSKSWRQTALQRRSSSNVKAQPKSELKSVTKSEAPAAELTGSKPVAREAITIPTSQALVDNYPYPKIAHSATGTKAEKISQLAPKEKGWSIPQSSQTGKEDGSSNLRLASARSTSEKLEGLPEDDIDFLSADEIRAAMGTRKSGTKSSEEKKLERQKLEIEFAAATPNVLDEAVEGHVLNNYYVRRTKQELERAQAASQASEVQRAESEQNRAKVHSEPIQIESSIDRMRRWIEEGGNSLAKHFWQDPVEAGAPSEADMQFAKQMAGLAKGRRAREHISDDLETDMPMCKGLLERLNNDENRVEHAVHLLRSPRKFVPGSEISKNLRAIRERRLRNTYERTEKQFEAACQSLRDLDKEVVQKATNAFKRRLGIASRILHKNHTLTRMLTWSAQARLDEPDLERSKAELYSEILTRLATLRDTQLALARLMDHAIQTFGVSLKPADDALSRPMPSSELKTPEAVVEAEATLPEKAGAKFLADAAAAARLTDEIQSQKTAMQGLSDDGYARAPRQAPRRSFEDRNPLAHSLFRPFNLQFEGLGKKTEGGEADDKLKEAFKQKMGNRKLVQAVRNAYEDVYGPITIEHQQPQLVDFANTKTSIARHQISQENFGEQAAAVDEKEVETLKAAAASEPVDIQAATKEAEQASVSIVPLSASEGITLEPPMISTAAGVADEVSQTPIHEIASSAPDVDTTEAVKNESGTAHLPTHYTILVHDPQTDVLSITTSTSGPPRDTSPALLIHQALSSLDAPAKFIPYINAGLEVITAKRHMLVLRDSLNKTSSTQSFETISAHSAVDTANELLNREVNPIDGTTRLSPTGYSGVEQSQEQLERDFEERRQAAAATEAARGKKRRQPVQDEGAPKKRRGGVGSVFKTAIWASAVCYIVGVTAEVLR